MLRANGVDLCVETFGDPADPAVLLIHGACASMLYWEEELCRRIARGGRYVIRFDNRDTGLSVAYPPGAPGYSMRDLAADAVGILDALGVDRAHVVGRSMSGGTAVIAALDHPGRVASLTLVTTTPGDGDLPPMSAEFLRYTGSGGPDPTDPTAVVNFVVGLVRAYGGGSGHFDEPAVRAVAERDVARTRNIASCLTNHFIMDLAGPVHGGLGDIDVPTLVVHGELDPVFPLPHGEALRRAVPGAELLVLAGAGHELPPPTWDVFVPALLAHTAR